MNLVDRQHPPQKVYIKNISSHVKVIFGVYLKKGESVVVDAELADIFIRMTPDQSWMKIIPVINNIGSLNPTRVVTKATEWQDWEWGNEA